MKFAIKIEDKYSFNKYTLLFSLDKYGLPKKLTTFKAKNEIEAYKKMTNLNFCINELRIDEEFLFKKFKLITLLKI